MDITIIAFFHILIINSLFIAVDNFILKRISKTKVFLLLVIIGGLTSLFLGVYLTNQVVEFIYHDQWFGFANGFVKKQLFIMGAIILTVCNILIEIPFYFLATKKLRQSIKSSLLSNLVTNVPVGLFYLWGELYYSHND